MIHFLFLFASIASAQNKAVLPVEDINKEGALQAVQQNLDSKFSVYGGTVAGKVIFSSVTYYTGQDANSNSIVVSSSVKIAGCINWGDGTQQCSRPATAATVLSASSTTTSGFTSSFNSAFGVANTTLTITTTGSRIAVWFTGAASGNAATRSCLNVLQDGAYIAPYTSSIGVVCNQTTSTNEMNLSFYIVLAAPSVGSHSYALTTNNTSGTASWDITNSNPQFGVSEVR